MSVGSDSSEKQKPETIEFYNKTKYGVDVADQMARQYSVKRAHADRQLLSFIIS